MGFSTMNSSVTRIALAIDSPLWSGADADDRAHYSRLRVETHEQHDRPAVLTDHRVLGIVAAHHGGRPLHDLRQRDHGVGAGLDA